MYEYIQCWKMQIFVKTPTGETVTIENEETGIQDRHSLKMKTVSEDLEGLCKWFC